MRGGDRCGATKPMMSTALQNMDNARGAVALARDTARDAMYKALKMNHRAGETDGGKALQKSIGQMDEALSQLDQAIIQAGEVHVCMHDQEPDPAPPNPGKFTGPLSDPPKKRWWQFWK
jgi:hypothetical protein